MARSLRLTCALTIQALSLVASACGDGPTAPAPRVAVTGPDSIEMRHGRYDNGIYRPECHLTPDVTVSGSGSIRWTRAVVDWFRVADGTWRGDMEMSAADVAEFWGAASVSAGTITAPGWIFWDAMPFRLVIDFHFTDNGKPGTVTYEVSCATLAPPLEGRYVLVSINGKPLPAPSASWYEVYGDTLTFFPNVTLITASTVRGADVYSHTSLPDPYRMLSKTEAQIFSVVQGVGGHDPSRIAGDTLIYTERECCGRSDYVWRFVKRGS